MPYSPMEVNHLYRETHHLHLQGQRINQVRNQCAAVAISLFLDPEDEGDMSLWKVCHLSTDYMGLYHRRQNSAQYIVSEHKGTGEIVTDYTSPPPQKKKHNGIYTSMGDQCNNKTYCQAWQIRDVNLRSIFTAGGGPSFQPIEKYGKTKRKA
jgi:hypothetical protein